MDFRLGRLKCIEGMKQTFPQMETVTGVVLAGGKSTRMGADKAWLEFNGSTLIERCVDSLRQCFSRVIIVANQPPAFASLGLPVFSDEVPGLGPIGGLLTALRRAESETIFLVACDMPFLNPHLIREMTSALDQHDAVVAQFNGPFEPLHAVYRRGILPVVEAQIAARQYSLQALVGKLRLKVLSEIELSQYSDWRNGFLNLNTPEEVQHARRRHGQ